MHIISLYFRILQKALIFVLVYTSNSIFIMADAVIMPRQGQSVESCILTEWYKDVGDEISTGDLLFAYETDKAAFEEEARCGGILLARFYEPGDEVPVLSNVAVIGKKGEAVDEFRPERAPAGDAATEIHFTDDREEISVLPDTGKIISDRPSSAEVLPGEGKNAISPRARKAARKKRIVIENITGSGPGGRIIERDILAEIQQGKRLTPLARKKVEEEGLYIPQKGNTPYGRLTTRDLEESAREPRISEQPSSGGAYTDIPLSNVRKIVAAAMHHSLQNSAQLTHHLSANASRLLQIREEVKKKMAAGYSYNITLNDMVCFAVIKALKKHPGANAHFVDGKIRQFKKVNLGLAVDTDRGLLVPALPDADDYSLPELSARLRALADSAREGSISPDLLAPEAASFTVSNLGNYGVEMFTPVINLPQVAILGVNTIIHRPAVLPDGSFGFQPFIGLSLTYDHRAIDGGPATLFLAGISRQVEKLSTELL